MKWITLVFSILLTACGLNNKDEMAYRGVIVTPPPKNKIELVKNNNSIDVTTNTIQRY